MRISTLRYSLLPVLLVATLLALPACDSALESEPVGSVSSETALNDQTGYTALLLSVYDYLQGAGYYAQGYMLEPEAQADNATVTQENSNRYPGVVAISNGNALGMYGTGYVAINQANIIIANIDGLDGDAIDGGPQEDQNFRDRLRGEALFLRALFYFDLARTYSYEPGVMVDGFDLGVIIRTEPTEDIEGASQQLSRSTVDEVYTLIKSDLNQAASLLEGVGDQNYPFRATRAAALHLLARVHLYAKEHSQAASVATDAIDAAADLVAASGFEGEPLVPTDGYVDAFLAEQNPEGVFILDMEGGTDGDATNTNGAISSLTTPGFFTFEVVASQDLLSLYSDDDVRFGLYEQGERAGQEVVYTRKWEDTEAPFVTDIEMLRTSELFLIRAEARARSGDMDNGLEDLNLIRRRAGLDDFNETGDALLDEILVQRRLEFALEGQRWWDLKRLGMDIPKPQAESDLSVLPYSGSPLSFYMLQAIPTTEVQSNPNLQQNPGY